MDLSPWKGVFRGRITHCGRDNFQPKIDVGTNTLKRNIMKFYKKR